MSRAILTKRNVLVASTALVVGLAIFWLSSHNDSESHNSHAGSHMGTSNMPTTMPTEVGQSAFAAIAEIVNILNLDPKTNWSNVNITALRDHLKDMKELTLNAKVEQTQTGNSITFKVTGEASTNDAIKRMVPAHTQMLASISSDLFEDQKIEELPNGIALTLSSKSNEQMTKLKAIGFFGYMATGAHHQQHHLLIAQGEPHH